jgi:shikimate dehydrogenase
MDVSEKAVLMEWFEWQEAPPAEFAVIGDPVSHSLSPRMHGAAFAAMGLPYRYVAVRVPEPEFEAAVARLTGLGYIGLNVTVPLKEEAFRWALNTDELTGRIKAANTLKLENKTATNTDAPGFLDVLEDIGVPPGSSVLLLGAGGAARAAAGAMHRAGYPFSVYNRSRDKAEAMVADLGLSAQVMSAPDPMGFSVIVNATSANLQGALLPVDWDRAMPGATALDLAYAVGPTPFLLAAASAGIHGYDGRGLLAAQGARSLEWWLGIEAPRSAMLKAIE